MKIELGVRPQNKGTEICFFMRIIVFFDVFVFRANHISI
jgi:hypothetical protein